MTWTKLLASKEAQKHKTSKKELDNMRALIARDLADAALAGLSADRRFATAPRCGYGGPRRLVLHRPDGPQTQQKAVADDER